MIKVLIVEDSPVVRDLLAHILRSDPGIEVIGTASNGEEALEFLRRKKPDVITMDINMPKMNGFEATRRIMEMNPTPIVIVSGSVDPTEVSTTFRAVEAGALTLVPRPAGIRHPEHEAGARSLVQTVKLMAEVKVVRRWASTLRKPRGSPGSPPESAPGVTVAKREAGAVVEVVAIGASTGGPLAIQTILSGLSQDFSASVLLVQHMAPGFITGFVNWLGQSSRLRISVASHDESISPSHAYVAPDGFQMAVTPARKIVLRGGGEENGLCPSVSHLFRSVAEVFGPRAVGVLLTGMGADGAEELKLMKERGAITIAQDEESSVVFGMPGEAIELGAATYTLPPEKIALALESAVGRRPPKEGY